MGRFRGSGSLPHAPACTGVRSCIFYDVFQTKHAACIAWSSLRTPYMGSPGKVVTTCMGLATRYHGEKNLSSKRFRWRNSSRGLRFQWRGRPSGRGRGGGDGDRSGDTDPVHAGPRMRARPLERAYARARGGAPEARDRLRDRDGRGGRRDELSARARSAERSTRTSAVLTKLSKIAQGDAAVRAGWRGGGGRSRPSDGAT